MTWSASRFRQAVGFLVAAAVAAAFGLLALRVVKSMQRGRGAAFSLAEPAALFPQKRAQDFLDPAAGAVTLPEGDLPVARRALALAAGGAATFDFVVPSSATFSFHTGARAGAAGVLRVETELLAPGLSAAVLDAREVSFPASAAVSSPLTAGWRRVDVDLAPWSGRRVTLRFRTDFRPSSPAASTGAVSAFWAAPSVWVPDPRPTPSRRAGPGAARGAQNAVWVVFESFPVAASHMAGDDFPGLSFLAREGVEFQKVYTNRTDAEGGLRRLLTGRLQERGEGPRAAQKTGRPFPAVLRQAGAQTTLLGAPPGDPAAWIDLGFDAVYGAPPSGAGGERVLRDAARHLARDGGRGPHLLMVFVRAPAQGEDPSPRCWLRAARLSPLSLFRGGRWRALAQAVQMDGALERLWAQVIRLGQDGSALLSVTSLRGPSYRPEPLRRTDDGRLFRRALPDPGWGLREEEVRVLWLMRHPRLSFGRKVTLPAQLLDAAPTALDLLDVQREDGMEGLSFVESNVRALRADQGARFLIEGAGGDALVLDGHYKYVRRAPARSVKVGGTPARTDFEPEELFDLWTDPGEKRNLARRRRDLLARARRAITEHLPERTAVRLVFQGYVDPPLQGVTRCPGGDLWNVALSTGELRRGGSNEVSFTVSAPESSFTFETWPPPASYSLLLRTRLGLPADAFLVSRLGLPLVEAEKRTEWFDENKFPWMDGFPAVVPSDGKPRVYMGRVPVRREAP